MKVISSIECPFLAQTCTFPFIFNGQNYTECTRVNDTQLWCSPTPMYTGQRFYCTFTGEFEDEQIIFLQQGDLCTEASLPSSNCSMGSVNGSVCDNVVPTELQPTEYLASLCTIPSLISVSPTSGGFGTYVTITGKSFL